MIEHMTVDGVHLCASSGLPIVQVSCACCFFDKAKPGSDVLNQRHQEKHQEEGPERTNELSHI